MCSNRNNPEEFVTAKRIAPTRAPTIYYKCMAPTPGTLGTGVRSGRRSLSAGRSSAAPILQRVDVTIFYNAYPRL